MIAAASPAGGPTCLRCTGQALHHLPGPPEGIRFFECPACRRHHAQEADGPLTYRWGHPVSLALYALCFAREEPDPSVALATARSLMENRTPAQADAFVREIELELAEPTQPVRAILQTPAAEDICRRFLSAVVAAMKRMGPGPDGPSRPG